MTKRDSNARVQDLLSRPQWFRAHGFIKDPFDIGSFQAETDPLFEERGLPAFVDPPQFEKIRGLPDQPGYCYIFAPPGGGKSSLRRRIKYEFDEGLSQKVFDTPRILAVEYLGHDYDFGEIDTRSHIIRIAHLVKRALAQRSIEAPLGITSSSSPRTLLEDIISACRANEIDGVCVLVDDINPQYGQDVQLAFDRIQQLAARADLLSIRGIFFKFMLPLELLEQAPGLLPLGRLSHYELEWNKANLRPVLRERLVACMEKLQRDRQKNSLSLLCDATFRDAILREIIDFGHREQNPRAMWQLGYHLFDEHFKMFPGEQCLRTDLVGRKALNRAYTQVRELRAESLIVEETGAEISESVDRFSNLSTETLRYLHISDLHLTYADVPDHGWAVDQFNRDLVTVSMLDKIEKLVQAGRSLDMVVITGDLAKHGKAKEYEVAEDFCRQLLEKTGVPSNRLYIVPGNHDVDRGEVLERHLRWWYSFENQNQILDTLSDNASFPVIMRKFSAFNDFVERVTGQRWYDERNYYMADSMHISKQSQRFCINLIGLNSALFAGYDGDDQRKLALGLHQVDQALQKLDSNALLTIVCFHHPFSCFHPADQVCQNRLIQKAEMILTGHLHEPANAFSRNAAGQAVLIGAGVSYEKRESEHNSFNIVEIDLKTGQGKVQFYKYLPTLDRWKENTDVNPDNPQGVFEFVIDKES